MYTVTARPKGLPANAIELPHRPAPCPGAARFTPPLPRPPRGTGQAIVVPPGQVPTTDTIIANDTAGIGQTAGSVFQDYNLFFGNGANTLGVVSGGAHSHTGDPVFANPARDERNIFRR